MFWLGELELLLKERAEVLTLLWLALENASDLAKDPVARAFAVENVNSATSPRSRHSSCAKAYERLYHENRDRAKEIYENCSLIGTVDVGDLTEAARMEMENKWGAVLIDRVVTFYQRMKTRIPWPAR